MSASHVEAIHVLTGKFDGINFNENDINRFNSNQQSNFDRNQRSRTFHNNNNWSNNVNTYNQNSTNNSYQSMNRPSLPLLNDQIGIFGASSFPQRVPFQAMGNSFRPRNNNNGFQPNRFQNDNFQNNFGIMNSQIQHWDNSMSSGSYTNHSQKRYNDYGNRRNNSNNNFNNNNVKPAEVNMKSFENISVTQSGPNWTPIEPLSSFHDLENLNDTLLKNIEKRGYTQPTPVQKYALKIVSAKRDLMACAQTGSGKTAAFLLPIFNMIIKEDLLDLENVEQRVAKPLLLVLAPTRELCCQINDEALKFSKNSPISCCVVYGGAPITAQKNNLSRGVHVLVATPGRLIDILQQGFVNLSQTKFLVFDEADRMLDMGFEPQIRKIITDHQMPPSSERQTLMFSATFPKEIQNLATDFMDSYIFLTVGRVGSTNENIIQEIISVEDQDKQTILVELLQKEDPSNLVLIFVSTKRGADDLCSFLDQYRFSVSAIHGDRDQNTRNRALNMFRTGRTPILVATAVAARGLDIPNVKHVINFDLPSDIEEYIHRIGRTGRIGADGKATSFYTPTKNRNIVNNLITLLQEAKQDIPHFLTLDLNNCNYRGRNSYGSNRNNKYGSNSFNNEGNRNRMSQNTINSRSTYGNFNNSSTQDYRIAHKTSTSYVSGNYFQNNPGNYNSTTNTNDVFNNGNNRGNNSFRIGHFNPQATAMLSQPWNQNNTIQTTILQHHQTQPTNFGTSGPGTSNATAQMDVYNAAAANFYNLMQHQAASKLPPPGTSEFFTSSNNTNQLTNAQHSTSTSGPSQHYFNQPPPTVDFYNQNNTPNNPSSIYINTGASISSSTNGQTAVMNMTPNPAFFTPSVSSGAIYGAHNNSPPNGIIGGQSNSNSNSHHSAPSVAYLSSSSALAAPYSQSNTVPPNMLPSNIDSQTIANGIEWYGMQMNTATNS